MARLVPLVLCWALSNAFPILLDGRSWNNNFQTSANTNGQKVNSLQEFNIGQKTLPLSSTNQLVAGSGSKAASIRECFLSPLQCLYKDNGPIRLRG